MTTTRSEKSWVYPANSGIRIREITNRRAGEIFGTSFQVTIPGKITGKGRMRQQFTTKEKAEKWAKEQHGGSLKIGEKFLQLDPAEMKAAMDALDLIRPHKLNLVDAVEFAIPRMRPEGGDKKVTDIVAVLVTSKENRFKAGGLRDRSRDDFKVRSRKFTDSFGDRLIKDVTAPEIKEWIQSLGLHVRSNKNYLAVLSEIFRYARRKNYIGVNPFDDFAPEELKEMRGNGDNGSEPNILSVDQADKLLKAAFENPDLDLLGAVTLGLFCGIRTQELTKLNWSHVRINSEKPEDSFVTIPHTIAKKRRVRNVTIPTNALAWLVHCKKDSGPLTKNKYSTDYRKRFLKLQQKAGFGKTEDGTWRSTWEENNMRHSFGTYHFALHGDSLETARLLGHRASDAVLFDHYRALATKEDAEKYFALMPPKSEEKIIQFDKVI